MTRWLRAALLVTLVVAAAACEKAEAPAPTPPIVQLMFFSKTGQRIMTNAEKMPSTMCPAYMLAKRRTASVSGRMKNVERNSSKNR